MSEPNEEFFHPIASDRSDPKYRGIETSEDKAEAEEVAEIVEEQVKDEDRSFELSKEIDVEAAAAGAEEAGDVEAGAADGSDDDEATPAARARASELGVDLDDVEGSGQDGRILVEDVDAAFAEDEDGA